MLVLQKKASGEIEKAVFKSPCGIKELQDLKGFVFLREESTTFDIDTDLSHTKGFLWKILFIEPKSKREGISLWIGALSKPSRAWLFKAPIATTLWDKTSVRILVPPGFSVYVSPKTPNYADLPSFSGMEVLPFVYTIGITTQGPAFVPSPEVYKQILPYVEKKWSEERNRRKKLAYSHLLHEYKLLSKGASPSTEAILNLKWQKVMTLEWN